MIGGWGGETRGGAGPGVVNHQVAPANSAWVDSVPRLATLALSSDTIDVGAYHRARNPQALGYHWTTSRATESSGLGPGVLAGRGRRDPGQHSGLPMQTNKNTLNK